MTHLQVQDIHPDKSHLVLVDGRGREYLLPINDRLYSLVRKQRAASIKPTGHVRPKEIQAMIRSGMSAQEVSEATGASLEYVQTYEHPVLAERAHTAYLAGQCPVYGDSDPDGLARPLAELCKERLRLRDVDPETVKWDAWKKNSGHWYVHLSFIAADKERSAGWEYSRGSVVPLDDEARWLSDSGPTDSGPIPTFGSAAERALNAAESGNTPSSDTETGRILEGLRRRRYRPDLHPNPAGASEATRTAGSFTQGDSSPTELTYGEPPEQVDKPSPERTQSKSEQEEIPLSHSVLPGQATLWPDAETHDAEADTSTYPENIEPMGTKDASSPEDNRRKRRSSVPSWDDIMFGTKRD